MISNLLLRISDNDYHNGNDHYNGNDHSNLIHINSVVFSKYRDVKIKHGSV